MLGIRRREFITVLSDAAALPIAAWAQQRVIGFLGSESLDLYTGRLDAFRKACEKRVLSRAAM